MKWAYQIRHKLKAAAVFTGIILVIILGNFSERSSFSDLDASMSSIYNDRLKPATYLYEISNNLYQKRLVLAHTGSTPDVPLDQAIRQHDQAIADLVRAYEKTMLTTEEKTAWKNFLASLENYQLMEQGLIAAAAENRGVELFSATTAGFNQTIRHLNELSRIQIGVGNSLQKSSHSIVSNTLMFANVEISLLIILALFTLVILSTTDKALFRHPQNSAMN